MRKDCLFPTIANGLKDIGQHGTISKSIHLPWNDNFKGPARRCRENLESVVSASAAGHDLTLTTLVDENGHKVAAFFTLIRTSVPPTLVLALVVLAQIVRDSPDLALSLGLLDALSIEFHR